MIGVAMGLLLVLAGAGGCARPSSDSAAPQATVDAVVATHDLYAGNPIGKDDVKVSAVPEVLTGPTVVRRVDDAVGQVPVDRILAGEPVRRERLYHSDPRVPGTQLLAGEQIFALHVPAETGAAFRDGDRVDLAGHLRSRPSPCRIAGEVAVMRSEQGDLLVALTPEQILRVGWVRSHGTVDIKRHAEGGTGSPACGPNVPAAKEGSR